MRLLYCTLVCALVFAFPAAASAQVIITEIMYDLAEGADDGREWVEIKNTGSESVDLTDWKFREGTTNHGITAMGAAEIPPGGYAVIADNAANFKTDWPSYSGLLFDSAFSLKNTGETLVMRCCGKQLSDIDSIAYTSEHGGNGDGFSLHREGSAFIAANPSPGSGAVIKTAPSPPEPEPKPELEPEPPRPQPKPELVKKEVSNPEPVRTDEDETAIIATSQKPREDPVAAKVEKKQATPEEQGSTKTMEIVQETKKVAINESETSTTKADLNTTTTSESDAAMVAAVETAVPAGDGGDGWMWWLMAIVVAGFGGAAVRYIHRLQNREWDIEEIQ